jgi:PmbA protein
MQRLLKKAAKYCDQAEVYLLEHMIDRITVQNMKLQDIESQIQSGVSLRIIKKGVLGFAYTRNLGDRSELLNNALNSLKGEVRVAFHFPKTLKVKALSTYDANIEELTNSAIVAECKKVTKYLKERTKGQININAGYARSSIRLLNSAGTDLSARFSTYFLAASLLYPRSYAGVRRIFSHKTFTPTPHDHLDSIINMYNSALEIVSIPGGPMKVLFLPESLYVLMWRIQSGTSGRSVHENQSPLADKIGKRICDEKITIMNDPLSDMSPGARAFDDEGTTCSRFPIITRGVLKNFYYDLDYACKRKTRATGHGFKTAQWGGETVALRPTPALEHLCIEPGHVSFKKLLARMDRGVIVVNALGAHSGNIPNGDFSIGLAPGLYVEKGEVVGRIKDAMVAGNVYDIMKKVVAVEDSARRTFMGMFPSILFDNIKVSTNA